ncbi:MAG: hypothetical protein ABSB91_09240 [Sedimentisphaerales bacterium]|jgi:hypothetical protein
MATDKQEVKVIHRSNVFILAAQLQGLCVALRQVVPSGLKPGKISIDLLKKLHNDFCSRTTGTAAKRIPEITDSISGFDLLALAETLYSTTVAFLTPEETEDYNKSFGFGKRNE